MTRIKACSAVRSQQVLLQLPDAEPQDMRVDRRRAEDILQQALSSPAAQAFAEHLLKNRPDAGSAR